MNRIPHLVRLSLILGMSLSFAGCNGLPSWVRQQTSASPSPTSNTPVAQANLNASNTTTSSAQTTGNSQTTAQATTSQTTTSSIPAGARFARLSGVSANTRINVRATPSTQSVILYQGLLNNRVAVIDQQVGQDGYIWYKVLFADNAQGWVHGTLVTLYDASGNPIQNYKPAPSQANSPPQRNPQQVALTTCRQRAEREINNGAQVQVSQNSLTSNGDFLVKWSTDSGASGTCIVNYDGAIIDFTNSTSNRPTTPFPSVVVDACRNRVKGEFPFLASSDIQVYPVSFNTDSVYSMTWTTGGGTRGNCRINRNGDTLAFVVTTQGNDRPPVSDSSGGVSCTGNIFGQTTYTARYGEGGFNRVDFTNTQTNYKFTVYLTYSGKNDQDKSVYKGRTNDQPPDEVTLVNLASGQPTPGSQISLSYNNVNTSQGTCK